MNYSHRNPVGVLHEKFQSGGVKPLYQLIRATGPPNAPTFSFQVSLGRMTCLGSGPSKKQAKIAAAQSMLFKLEKEETASKANENRSVEDVEESTRSKVSAVKVEPKSSVDMLEDMCAEHGYRAPVYDDEREQDKSFFIICSVGEIKKTGVGRSRGHARNEAAHRMLDMLRSLIPKASLVESSEDSFDKGRVTDKVTDENFSNLNKVPVSSEKISEIVDEQLVSSLQTTNLKENRKDFMCILNEVGKQEKLVVTCVEEKIGNLTQCLIQLNTVPVAVSCGIGKDIEKVQESAARDMLNYLKMLTSSTN